MGVLTFFSILIAGGALCGYVAAARVTPLRREVARLRDELRDLREQATEKDYQGSQVSTSTRRSEDEAAPKKPSIAQSRYERQGPSSQGEKAYTGVVDDSRPEGTNLRRGTSRSFASTQRATEESRAPAYNPRDLGRVNTPEATPPVFEHIRENWMIWLGAICVSLAGIFLVRYSIEAGVLGPKARIGTGLIFGLACHAVAEWVRRKSGWSFAAMAALAGSGSIILYGSLLSALRLYNLIDPGIAFALLALVALGTMFMARLHGPLLAAFGILGAFLVPILVSTGGGNIRVLLIYSTIVALSALLLMRHVYRDWLWWGFAIGALFWGLLATSNTGLGGEVSLYFALLAYLTASVPEADWLLKREVSLTTRSYNPRLLLAGSELRDRHRLFLYLLLAGGVFLAIWSDANAAKPWLYGAPFLLISLLLTRRQDQLCWLPWISLLSIATAWLLSRVNLGVSPLQLDLISPEEQASFFGFLLSQALLTSGFSLWFLPSSRRPAVFASLAALAPGLLLALAYLLTTRPLTNWNWGMGTAILALAYLATAATALRRMAIESLVVWFFVGGHVLLALAATIILREASLSLAIAAQLLSLAWVIQRFELPELGWLLKTVVAVVIARLTLNPWLADYPQGVHWSLWTYGGATIFAAVAAQVLKSYPALRAWLGGAALHLMVLTLWAELRYQLYEGGVFSRQFSFSEAVIGMHLVGSLALVYRYRLRFSEHMRSFMRAYSLLLLLGAALLYLVITLRTISSDAWVFTAVSSRPVFNLGTLAFFGPVSILSVLALLTRSAYRRGVLAVLGIAAWIAVSLQIRHLWTGTLRLDGPEVSNGELYTYSVVWLLMAITAMLVGAARSGQDVYRAGLVLLALVIAKLFFWDMSGLEGLLRVASFMGLGLSLLALSFLHQRLSRQSA